MHTLIRGWENVVCLVLYQFEIEKGKKYWNKREKENTDTYVTPLMIIIIIIIVFAHVIVCQIGMIGLYTVVKYWDDNVFASIPFLPSRTHIHVETV